MHGTGNQPPGRSTIDTPIRKTFFGCCASADNSSAKNKTLRAKQNILLLPDLSPHTNQKLAKAQGLEREFEGKTVSRLRLTL
jgi:hypothetical protein